MSTEIAPVTQKSKISALAVMAERYQVEPQKLLETLKATVFKNATNEELLALVVVANAYGLSPLTREIYAFPGKSGGIVPVISIDGWANLANSHPQMDGIDFEWDHGADGKLVSCTSVIYRKDRSHPIRVTEYLAECRRNTEPWKMEHRMLRHKALSQGVRIAFGFSGVYDEDEARDITLRTERETNGTDRRTAPVPELLRETTMPLPESTGTNVPASMKQTTTAAPKDKTEPPLEAQQEAWWPPQEEEQEPSPMSKTVDAVAKEIAKPQEPAKPMEEQPSTQPTPLEWRDCIIHFGTQTLGKRLGEIPKKTLAWMQTTWMSAAKEQTASLTFEDAALIKALESSLQPMKTGA